MSCKHLRVEGNTTKYFVCGITEKAIDEYKCRDCMMKIDDNAEEKINEIFRQIFKEGSE